MITPPQKHKMHLHILKNSRTFDVQNETEQSNSIFINQNKPRRSGASPATSVYPARSAATWALFTTFYLMQTEKTPTQKPTMGIPPTIKVEFENAQDFVIYAQYSHMRAVIRGWKRKHLPKILQSLTATYQQQ